MTENPFLSGNGTLKTKKWTQIVAAQLCQESGTTNDGSNDQYGSWMTIETGTIGYRVIPHAESIIKLAGVV